VKQIAFAFDARFLDDEKKTCKEFKDKK